MKIHCLVGRTKELSELSNSQMCDEFQQFPFVGGVRDDLWAGNVDIVVANTAVERTRIL